MNMRNNNTTYTLSPYNILYSVRWYLMRVHLGAVFFCFVCAVIAGVSIHTE